MSPFYLMFGQEPRLPVDFLLDRVPEPMGGDVHEWIQEHQTRLKVAFAGAREWLGTRRNTDRRSVGVVVGSGHEGPS